MPAKSVDEARQTAAEKAQAVSQALISADVPEADRPTTQYTIQPEHDYSGRRKRLLGYRVTNVVQATLRDLRRAGEGVDSATAAGGDHTNVNGLGFDVGDPSSLEREARAGAWAQALDKATQLADLSRQTLGTATLITETVRGPVVPMRLMGQAAMAESAPTPVQPGATEVSLTLQVEFALEARGE